MSDYCILNKQFWSDTYVSEELDTAGKLVYLYLMTNSAVNIAGLYEISRRRIAFETGVPDDEIGNILEKLGADGKIVYDGRICWLCNFHKYNNWKYSPNTIKGVVNYVNAAPAGIVRDAYIEYFSALEGYEDIAKGFARASEGAYKGLIRGLQGACKEPEGAFKYLNTNTKYIIQNTKNKEHSAPDGAGDSAGWWSCMREEAGRAEAFGNATGLKPIKNEFGRWQKDLRAFTEAGISIEAMLRAVERMKRDGLTISAPGSVFKVARSIAAEAPAKGLSDDDILQAMGGGHD